MGKQNEQYTHRCRHKHVKLCNFEIVPSNSRLCYNLLLFLCESVWSISMSIIVRPSCVDCVYAAQTHSPSLVLSDETPVPTNRRFLFSHHGINRKVSWDCGLRTIALPLISADPLPRTESLQHHAQPAVSAQEKLCCGMRFCGLQTTSRSAN